jgi:hypothetical protein
MSNVACRMPSMPIKLCTRHATRLGIALIPDRCSLALHLGRSDLAFVACSFDTLWGVSFHVQTRPHLMIKSNCHPYSASGVSAFKSILHLDAESVRM